jgi:hypothetical protein
MTGNSIIMKPLINRIIFLPAVFLLTGLFYESSAQLASSQPASVLTAKYKVQLDELRLANSSSSFRGRQSLPSAHNISVAAIETRLRRKMFLAPVSRSVGPKQMPSALPFSVLKKMGERRVKPRF